MQIPCGQFRPMPLVGTRSVHIVGYWLGSPFGDPSGVSNLRCGWTGGCMSGLLDSLARPGRYLLVPCPILLQSHLLLPR